MDVTPSTARDAVATARWIADRLDEEHLPYAISGALALAAHGVPRMTKDVDLAVFTATESLDRLFTALDRSGAVFDRRVARLDIQRMALFRVRCGSVLVDLFISSPEHHQETLARRLRLAGRDGREHWYLSAEDLAVHKLALFRPRDRDDLRGLFAVQGTRLDLAYVRRWIEAIAPPGDPRRDELSQLATPIRSP
jgi:hypothetical protein